MQYGSTLYHSNHPGIAQGVCKVEHASEPVVWVAGVCIQTRTGNTKGIQSIALSPDASMVLAGSDDTTARVYGFHNA